LELKADLSRKEVNLSWTTKLVGATDMRIVVEPYDPSWPLAFEKAKASLETVLKEVPYVSIEHVGSTAIPGMIAKPVLDIDIVVKPLNFAIARDRLVGAGYFDCGDMNGRYAFRQPGYGRSDPATGEKTANGEIRRNTYLMIEGSSASRNHRDLKRILLENAELREEYGEVKRRLAAREVEDMGEYAGGKSKIIRKILAEAGWKDEDFGPTEEVKA
jgi:GrpB-like predicted nucleotidyltransferase (UPF0157 family)